MQQTSLDAQAATNEATHDEQEDPSVLAPKPAYSPQQDADIVFPKTGELAEGIIVAKKPATLFVDLGAVGTGIIFGREFSNAKEYIRGLAIGDAIKAKVVELDNDDGYIELSLEGAGHDMTWQKLRAKMESREIFSAIIESANRGGLVVDIEGVQAFLPVSQLSVEHYPRVEGGDKDKILQELQKLVGKRLMVQILDIDPAQDKVILSERLAEEAATAEKLKQFHVGDVVSGTVSGVVDFGVFIKFGGDRDLEGLAHISELDWQLVSDPRQLHHAGNEVKAKIIGIDGGKVSLSLKALKKDPWDAAVATFQRGDVVSGKITRYNPFGVFVEVAPGVQGLAHIAEFRTAEKMREEMKLGETHEFRIATLEPKEHRMSLKPVRDTVEDVPGQESSPRQDVPGGQTEDEKTKEGSTATDTSSSTTADDAVER